MRFGVAGQTADGTTNQPNESNPGGNTVEGANTSGATQDRLDQQGDGEEVDGQTYNQGQPQPSVTDLGIDVDKVQESDPVSGILADVAAATALAQQPAGDDEVVYSSHPIQRMLIGVFQFENTILKLKGKLVDEFERLLAGLPPQDRLNIRKIDTNIANQIVQDRMDANSMATRAFDSSVGRSALAAMQAANPVVGTKPLEEMNQPAVGFAQGAGNQPVILDAKPDGDGTEPQG